MAACLTTWQRFERRILYLLVVFCISATLTAMSLGDWRDATVIPGHVASPEVARHEVEDVSTKNNSAVKKRHVLSLVLEKHAKYLADIDKKNQRWLGRHPKGIRTNLEVFKTVMTQEERDILFNLSATFTKVCQNKNIAYFMYGGTLLGSYRHHDLIPWDDDIDVILHVKFKKLLYKSLVEYNSNYTAVVAGPRLKYFAKDSQKVDRYPWSWPYVDIHFYTGNRTHIWDASREFRNYIYPRSVIFPLHQRPMGPISLPAPFDSYASLKLTYTSSHCTTHYYSHRKEKLAKVRQQTVDCEVLKNIIPFVHRRKATDSDGITETLMLNGQTIHVITAEEPQYAISKPYTLELM